MNAGVRSENWKADLFSPISSGTYAGAVIVAHKFFEWLHKQLLKDGVNPNAQRARVCVPALENVEPYASTIAQVMEASGWRDVEIIKVSEPRANAVGIMSGGRNCLLTNNIPGYGPMYGPGSDYARWAREQMHAQREPSVRVCIVDVGSFTTDLAAITVNLQTEQSDGIHTVIQKSWAFGIINELDKRCLPELLASRGLSTSTLTFTEQEDLKENLYAGTEFAVLRATLGGSSDQEIVSNRIKEFGAGITIRLRDDISAFRPEYAYLTGGGSRIPRLRQTLIDFLANLGCRVIQLPFIDARCTEAPAERVASALGAGGMILDARDPEAITEVSFDDQPRDPTFIKCRCQGGNKDCCFCWGRGYYRRAIAA